MSVYGSCKVGNKDLLPAKKREKRRNKENIFSMMIYFRACSRFFAGRFLFFTRYHTTLQ